ncbi:MAG: diguanylate cyclase [Deltaproteobacteria bacterium]|nr:diguanylate cyclase [Deltaproteobacteria bacterium]
MKMYEAMTREDLIRELENLRKRRAEWETLEDQRMMSENALLNQKSDLNKRIKELNSLYSLSRLVEEGDSLEEIIQGTAELIPPALQYPEIACARIVMNNKEYRTKHCSISDCKLSRDIIVDAQPIGVLEICYRIDSSMEEDHRFLPEEENLVKAIAERLGRIIERKRTEEALHESEEKYSTVVEKARDGIVIIQDNIYKYVNRSMTAISGYNTEELLNMHFLDIFASEYKDLLGQRYEMRLSGEEIPPVYEAKIQTKDGTMKNVEVSFGIITYQRKPADMGFIRDITERIKAQEEIKRLAYHDALTGLPNRVLFNEQYILAQAHAKRHKKGLGIILLDLDHFKEVNDTLGHNVGDQLLQMAGERLSTLIREEDVVARMGGDEFMILLQEIDDEANVTTISRKIVEVFRKPFLFYGQELHITTSVGVAIYPHDGEDINTLLKNADIAMYRAKEHGRNRYMLYSQLTQDEIDAY